MNRIKSLSRSGWLVVGLLAGLVLAPSAAIATATGLTELVGPGGHRASVTIAGQLNVAQAAPSDFAFRLASVDTTSSFCQAAHVISHKLGFIVTEITVDTFDLPSPGANDSVVIFEGAHCTPKMVVTVVNPGSFGLTVVPLNPGLGLPAGGTMSIKVSDMGALANIYGYTVPSKDVPGYTPNGG